MLCRVALRTQMVKQRIDSEVQIKVLIEPMNNPLGVSPSKGNQVTTRGKEKIFDLGGNRTHDLRIRSTVTLPTELRGRGFDSHRGQGFFLYLVWLPDSLY